MKRASEKEGNAIHKKPKSNTGTFGVMRLSPKISQSNGAKAFPAATASPASSNAHIETIVLSSDEENDSPAPSFMHKPKSSKIPSAKAFPSDQDLRSMGFTISKQASPPSKQPLSSAGSSSMPKSKKPISQLSPKLPKKKNSSASTSSNKEPRSSIKKGLSDDDDEDKEEMDELESDSDAEGAAVAAAKEQKQQQQHKHKHGKILPITTLQTRPPPSFPFSETSTLNEILKRMDDSSSSRSPQSSASSQHNDEFARTFAAMRRLPARESRNKVTTYSDIVNSLDPNQFAADYLSSADDESEIDLSNYPNAFAQHRDNHTAIMAKHTTQANLARPRRLLKTGFVYDTAMSYHATPDDTEIHPEDPRRIFKIFNIMERHGLLTECKRIKSRRATKDEILLVHNITHYRTLRNTSGRPMRPRGSSSAVLNIT